ncbi:TonB-dependent siderophore receptor [Pseudomonas solani]|uniref:TonB-dependent siderophore receptor n=1 Tax=Pseudomonas solani TaxID=2731552 RepID=UPI0035BE645E
MAVQRSPDSLARAVRAALLSLSLPLVALPAMVLAAPATQGYQIPAGSLDAALNAFARQAGVLLSFDPALTSGRRSAGLQGRYPVEQGFARLLAGSGLRVVQAADGGYRLEAAKVEDGQVELDSVNITGNQVGDSAVGTVGGYVAKRTRTGTKTDASILETPQSITVISREQMQARGVATVEEALRYSPSVSTPYGYDPRYDWMSLRGFDAKGSTYRDGLMLNRSTYGLARPDAYLLERVEVLRGPASVLYGQSEPGGIVNLVSKRAPDTPLHEVRLRAGSDDLGELAGDFGGPLDDQGQLLYRVTLLGNDANGQVDKVGNQRQALAPTLTWRPSDDTELTLFGMYQKDEGDFAFSRRFSPVLVKAFRLPYNRDEDFYEGEPSFNRFYRAYTSFGYELSHQLNDSWTLRQNMRYERMNFDYRYLNNSGVSFGTTTLARTANDKDEQFDGWTLDNQAQVDFGTGALAHTLLLGVDWRRVSSNEISRFGSAPTLNLLNPVYGQAVPWPAKDADNDITRRQTGFYAQDQIRFDDHWHLLLGGRYDLARSDTESNLNGSRTNRDDEAFTGRVGLVYVADNGLAPYVSYSESFNPSTSSDPVSGQPFDPETGKQYEVGIKFQPEGARSFVSLALFDITKQNVVSSNPNNPSERRQVGEVRSKGLEIEALANLADGLDLTASYSRTNARIQKSVNAWEEGARLQFVPREQAGLWLDYTLQGGPLAGFGVGGGARYIGATSFTGQNPFFGLYGPRVMEVETGGYTLFDASLHYELDGVRLALNASNLGDKSYASSCDTQACYYGYGRTLTASATYNW